MHRLFLFYMMIGVFYIISELLICIHVISAKRPKKTPAFSLIRFSSWHVILTNLRKKIMENTVILTGSEELVHIAEIADAAGISQEQKAMVLRAAKELTPDELQRCIEILKTSELRFSLVAELISFAKSDGNYGEEEKQNIEAMAEQLGISHKQFSLLDNFVTKANESGVPSQEIPKQGFLESLGLGDKFKSEGMNMSGIGKGLLAVAAPLLLGQLFRRKISGRPGGLSPMGGFGAGAGLGSVLSALNIGRGYSNTGGLLGRLFGRRRF
jgi:uncharacterized tellurite resistance protein B-like protein